MKILLLYSIYIAVILEKCLNLCVVSEQILTCKQTLTKTQYTMQQSN